MIRRFSRLQLCSAAILSIACFSTALAQPDCPQLVPPTIIRPPLAELNPGNLPFLIQFGHALQVIDDVLVIGAPGRSSTMANYNDGAVYFYRRINGVWTLLDIEYPPSDPIPSNYPRRQLGLWIGSSTTYAAAGTYGIPIHVDMGVGSSGEPTFTRHDLTIVNPPPTFISGGYAKCAGPYLFTGDGGGFYAWLRSATVPGGWRVLMQLGPGSVQTLYNTPASPPVFPNSARAPATSIDFDGVTAAVGGSSDPDVVDGGGAVSIFEPVGETFVLRQKIVTPVATPCVGFGRSVAVLGDTMVVGAYNDREFTIGLNQSCLTLGRGGFAAVYHRSIVGALPHWDLVTILRKPGGGPNDVDGFGCAVALAPGRIAVGAYLDDQFGLDAGAVFPYEFRDGSWQSRGVLGLTDSGGAKLGHHVDFNGNDIVASAPFYGENQAGAVFIFGPCSQTPDPSTGPHCIPGIYGLVVFVNAWFGQDPFADFDRDGHLSVFDLFEYLNQWMIGCP